jgi:hypothetical protein
MTGVVQVLGGNNLVKWVDRKASDTAGSVFGVGARELRVVANSLNESNAAWVLKTMADSRWLRLWGSGWRGPSWEVKGLMRPWWRCGKYERPGVVVERMGAPLYFVGFLPRAGGGSTGRGARRAYVEGSEIVGVQRGERGFLVVVVEAWCK